MADQVETEFPFSRDNLCRGAAIIHGATCNDISAVGRPANAHDMARTARVEKGALDLGLLGPVDRVPHAHRVVCTLRGQVGADRVPRYALDKVAVSLQDCDTLKLGVAIPHD